MKKINKMLREMLNYDKIIKNNKTIFNQTQLINNIMLII